MWENLFWLFVSQAYLIIVFPFLPGLLHLTLGITAIASKLLDRYPKLATMENEGGFTALQMLAQICEFY